MRLDSALIQEAWGVRARNFPPSVTFHRPVSTWSVSVTGGQCALRCAHCGGRFLKNMLPWASFKRRVSVVDPTGRPAATSCLVSGGCDRHGRVPFHAYVEELRALKRTRALRFNFHTGLAGEKEALLLQGLADKVSFDFVGDDLTIRNVLRLSKSVADYAAAYQTLRARLPVVPHICIGLDGGRINGEYRALELLVELGADALVFIVFMPVSGTALADQAPPPLDEVVHLLARARLLFPDIPLHLGCMRPGGRYRRRLDYWALHCGLNHLATPSREAAAEAERLGLEVNHRKECCVL
ncbi:MAG: radical SAM protein [Candidatus Desulforudis sp.]|nr:radical SAM protein [Desulforudis sp.]